MISKLLPLFIAVFLFSQTSFSQAGSPDKSFGENGVAKIPVVLLHKNVYISPTKILQLNNGKFIVAVSAPSYETYLYRINKNGTLDTSFADEGRKIILSGIDTPYLFDVIADSNNNIIVSTGITNVINPFFTLTRYKPNGVIDISFGDSGSIVIKNMTGGHGMLSLQPDGKLLVSATQIPLTGNKLWNFTLYRFTQNGLPDSSFNTKGSVFFKNQFNGYYPHGDNYYYPAVQPNNKIIYAGTAISQINENGKKNKLFADSGKIEGDSINYDGHFYKEVFSNVHVFNDGGFMCISVYNVPDRNGDGTITSRVYKFKSNGTPDNSFASGNEVVVNTTNYYSDFTDVAPFADYLNVQSDGKFILSVGYEQAYSIFPESSVISRYLPNGTLDKSFANGGSIQKDGHAVTGIVLQKDNKIVTLESIITASAPADTAYFYLYRYKNNVTTTNKLPTPDNVIAKSISSINISPNPAQSILHITGLQSNTKLSIVNELGKTVAQANTSNDIYDWNIQKLSAGNYFLVASQNNKRVASIKFIKQ